MATKIETIDNGLVITDTNTSTVIFDAPRFEYYYDVEKLEQEAIIKLENIDNKDSVFNNPPEIKLSDAVDSSDTLYTEESFKTFARNNLGQ